MIRRILPRLLSRAFLPRVSAPILPLTSRLRTSPLTHATNVYDSRPFHHSPPRLSSSRSEPPSPSDTPPPLTNATLSQRLRHLMKTYGWYALGVYLVLSAVDFGVAFAGINLLGAEQVSRVASSIKAYVAGLIHSRPPEPGRDEVEDMTMGGKAGQEGIYAMLVLAYTIHKTLFVPVRIGLTAALTPKLVAWLGRRGWVGGEGARRAANEMREKLRRGRE